MAEGKTIAMFGLLGAGGFLFYEYSQYNNALNTLASQAGLSGANASSAIANAQALLPFTTYISMKLLGSAATSTNQASLYNQIQTAASGVAVSVAPTPGTTAAGQPTSVTTAPPSTTPTATTGTSTPSSMQTLAANMQTSIGMTSASADHWNVAFANVMGQGIDAKYGFNFDTVYGPVVNGVRNNGATMSALMFLQLAAAIPGGLPGLSGLGSAFVHFREPLVNTTGSLLFKAHHPTPYGLNRMGGVGAYTQTTGFEKALYAGRPLRSIRVR